MLVNDPQVGEVFTYPHKDGAGMVRITVVRIFFRPTGRERTQEKWVQFETLNGPWGGYAKFEIFKELAISETEAEYQKRL